jgi:hypothetical protein
MTLDDAIRIGELLVGKKAALGHGQWLPWVEANAQFSEATAQRYMNCWRRREELKSRIVRDLNDAYRLFAAPEPEPKPPAKIAQVPQDAPAPHKQATIAPRSEPAEDPSPQAKAHIGRAVETRRPQEAPQAPGVDSSPEPQPPPRPDFATVLRSVVNHIVAAYNSIEQTQRVRLLRELSAALATLKEEK